MHLAAVPEGYQLAGQAASVENASAVYYNPARMTSIDKRLFTIAVTPTVPRFNSLKWHDRGSIVIPTQRRMSGNNGHISAGYSWSVPFFFVIPSQCNDRLWYGLGVNNPLEVSSHCSKHWKGRYYLLRNSIHSWNINPSIAYKINDCWSVGAGIDIVYAHAHISQAIDFGLFGAFTGARSAPEKHDGKSIIKGNAWGFGVNLGIVYDYSPCTRFALTYRSQQKLHFKGSARFKHRPSFIAYLPTFFNDCRARFGYRIPDTIDLAFYHKFNHCWGLGGDILWTHWKLNERLTTHFSSCIPYNVPHTTHKTHWRNNFSYGLSLHYTPCYLWSFRADVRYEDSPVRNAFLMDFYQPYPSNVTGTLTATYSLSACTKMTLYYTHFFETRARINNTISTLPFDRFNGGMKGHLDITRNFFTLQLTNSF